MATYPRCWPAAAVDAPAIKGSKGRWSSERGAAKKHRTFVPSPILPWTGVLVESPHRLPRGKPLGCCDWTESALQRCILLSRLIL